METTESYNSDAEVTFKESRNDARSNLQNSGEESQTGARRGRRPRTRPRSYLDFFEIPIRKSSNPKQAAQNDSSSSDSELEDSKQKTTSLFTNDDVEGQDIFKFKSRHTKRDLQNKVNSALNSPKMSELTPKTPKKTRLSSIKNNVESTPKHVKEIMKKRILNTIESDESDGDFSASSSDFVPDEDKSDEEAISSSSSAESEEMAVERSPPPARGRAIRLQLRRTDARVRRDADYIVAPDSYFTMNSNKKTTTSDHTLERLKNYQPAEIQLIDIEEQSEEHKTKITALNESHENLFNRWLYVLTENYSVLLCGVGSKRWLLQKFQATKLKEFPCVVVNGFFPSLTIKSILDSIIVDLLEYTQVPTNLRDSMNLIEKKLNEEDLELFLLIHNIDGAMLQNHKAQNVLANLSRISNVHTIASIDHINAPLIWDHTKLSQFNFTWWDVTTFMPYTAETSYENSLTSHRGGALQLTSLRSVYRSLTSNAKKVFNIIVEHQLLNHKVSHYQGIAFKDLYSKSREQFLVSSDIALRAQLTEFLDHKLVKMKRSGDGENLVIPIDNALLQQFLDSVEC